MSHRKRVATGVKKSARQILIYASVVLVMIYVLAPFAWLVISSIMPRVELLSFPPHWIPENPTWDNFKYLFVARPPLERGEALMDVMKTPEEYLHGLKNSVVIATSVTTLTLIFGTLAAYSLSRVSWPGKTAILVGFLGLRMIPGVATDIPAYMIFSRTGLIDTLFLIVVIETAWLFPFTIFILYGVFRGIPFELEDAAMVDGCNRLQSLVRIILPLAAPGLVAAGTFAFLGSWNSFFTPLIFGQNNAKTFIVTIAELVTSVSADYTSIAAAGVFAALPPIILALAFQRYVVRGLTEGGVKG